MKQLNNLGGFVAKSLIILLICALFCSVSALFAEDEENAGPDADWDDNAKEYIKKMNDAIYDPTKEDLKEIECKVWGTYKDTKLQKEKAGFTGVMKWKNKEVYHFVLEAADDITALFSDQMLEDQTNEWYEFHGVGGDFNNFIARGKEKNNGYILERWSKSVDGDGNELDPVHGFTISLDKNFVPSSYEYFSPIKGKWEGVWEKLPNGKWIMVSEEESRSSSPYYVEAMEDDETTITWKKAGKYYLITGITQHVTYKHRLDRIGKTTYDIELNYSDFKINGEKVEIEDIPKAPADDGDSGEE